jgi:ribose/xylose/arabinose/galactoside ABC-type transport system permease subunit
LTTPSPLEPPAVELQPRSRFRGQSGHGSARVIAGRLVPLSGIFGALGILVIVTGTLEPTLLSGNDLRLLARTASITGLLAVGQTVVMLTGGIDLSVGSVVAVVNWVGATVLAGKDGNNLEAIALCLGIGALVGLVNGVGIAKLRVPPFVMTLGMLFAVVAAGDIYTNGVTTGTASPFLIHVAQNSAGPIPIAFLIFAGVALLVHALLRLAPYGRRVYALGANPRAAHLAGIDATRVLLASYVLSGLTAALGGLILTGYIQMGATTSGHGAELDAIAAVVIGGTSLAGGRGSVLGTVGGVLFLGLLFNLLVVLNIQEWGRMTVQGSAIVLAGATYARLSARR